MSIALSIGNNLTTNGVFTSSAVNNTSVNNVTDFASVPGGVVLKLLSTQTASASATISFTSGIDSTYDSYVFKFINIHPATNAQFTFNLSTDGGSNYNVTKTTTFVRSEHKENDTDAGLAYNTGADLAQSTSYQPINLSTGTGNSDSLSGTLQIFNPSSTTFVKHFVSKSVTRHVETPTYCIHSLMSGYGNTTSAVNAIRFQMSSGNIDAGIIKMYGVV